MTIEITAGEWLVSPGYRDTWTRWDCIQCPRIGGITVGGVAREAAAAHVRATGHTVSVVRSDEEILHGMATR